jgi:hypothetical protein
MEETYLEPLLPEKGSKESRFPASLCWSFIKLMCGLTLCLVGNNYCTPLEHRGPGPAVAELILPVVFYFLAVLIHIYYWFTENNTDITSEVVEICFSYRIIDTEGMNFLLNPGPCLVASCEILAMMIYYFGDSYYCPAVGYLKCILFALEVLTPFPVYFLSHISATHPLELLLTCLKRIFDLPVIFTFVRVMETATLPLSWLKYLSEWNINKNGEGEHGNQNFLSFELCSKWIDVPLGASFLERMIIYCKKLSERYVVLYSFGKLLISVAFSLILDLDYTYCGSSNQHAQTITWNNVTTSCYGDVVPFKYVAGSYIDAGCSYSNMDMNSYSFMNIYGFCVGNGYTYNFTGRPYVSSSSCTSDTAHYCGSCECYCHQYPGLCPSSEQAYCLKTCQTPYSVSASLSSQCICNNWMVFEFIVMAFHAIHFIMQCYYYIRFDHFNPQQHQILCVQQYQFVGENLKLFLTHPAICFLALLEAGAILIVWIQVLYQPGLFSYSNFAFYPGSVDGFSFNLFALEFALVTTVVEVYKANLSVCWTKLLQREYGLAIWSLLRLDLFVFFGFTLLFQSFIFVYALGAYFCVEFVMPLVEFMILGDKEENKRPIENRFSSVVSDENIDAL